MKKYFLVFIFTAAAFFLAYGFKQKAISAGEKTQIVELLNADGGLVSSHATIQACADIVSAGQTCLVYPGTYDERVKLSVTGTTANKVTFKSAVRRQALVTKGFDTTGYGTTRIVSSYLRIEGFKLNALSNNWHTGGVWLEGNNIEIVDNYFERTTIVTSWNGYWSNILVKDNLIDMAPAGITARGYNWIVENNEVNRMINTGDGDSDYARFFGDNITFRRNYFHGTLNSEIGTSHVDCFQTFDDNGEFAHEIIIENNFCESFHEGLMQESYYHDNMSDFLFRNNIFDGGDIGGAWGISAHGVKDLKAYNNLFIRLMYHGIGVRSNATATIKNNIFYNVGNPYWAGSGGSLTASNNLLFNSSKTFAQGDYPDNIVNIDPQLIDPSDLAGADNIPFNSDDGYTLQSNSAAIDAGANELPNRSRAAGYQQPSSVG